MAAPFFCTVIIISRCEIFAKKRIWWPVFIALIAAGFISPYTPVLSGSDYDNSDYDVAKYNRGISDERGFYYQHSSFLKALKGKKMPSYFTVEQGKILKKDGLRHILAQVIGFMGYYGGPDVYIIDPFALSEPLLARMPVPDYRKGRVGHYKRNFPQGYLASISAERNLIVSENLSKYYDELCVITQGELFGKKRLVNIWKINTGQFKYLLKAYKKNFNYY